MIEQPIETSDDSHNPGTMLQVRWWGYKQRWCSSRTLCGQARPPPGTRPMPCWLMHH